MIEGFTVKSMKCEVPAKYVHLAPDRFHAESVQFDLVGTNVGVANAVRRAVSLEIPTYSLNFSEEDFNTDDPYILIDLIQSRIRCIPIDQSISPKATFTLSARAAEIPLRVYTRDIVMLGKGKSKGKGKETAAALPFNGNIHLFTLQPTRKLELAKIYVEQGTGLNFAGHAVAFNAVSLWKDEEIFSMYEKSGKLSSEINPRNFTIRFNTNGTMRAQDIVIAACNSIIGRLESLRGAIPTIESDGDLHLVILPGESHTIGNLVISTICELYPEIAAATYFVDEYNSILTLKLRCTEPDLVLETTCDHLHSVFTKLISAV